MEVIVETEAEGTEEDLLVANLQQQDPREEEKRIEVPAEIDQPVHPKALNLVPAQMRKTRDVVKKIRRTERTTKEEKKVLRKTVEMGNQRTMRKLPSLAQSPDQDLNPDLALAPNQALENKYFQFQLLLKF